MMKKKITVCAVFTALVCGISANAAEISAPYIDLVPNSVASRISGSVDLAELGYTDAQIRGREPYMPLSISFSVTDPNSGKVLYANQTVAQDDGTFSADFILPVDDGTYTLKIFSAYAKLYEGEFAYHDGTVSGLNSAAEEGDSAVLEKFVKENANYMGLDLKLFRQFTDDERLLVMDALGEKAPYDSKQAVRQILENEVFGVGLITVTLSDEQKANMLYSYIDEQGEDYAKYGEFIRENDLAKTVIEKFNASDFDTVRDGLAELALTAYTDTKIQNMYNFEVLIDGNLFNIPSKVLDKYNKVSQKTEIFTALYNRKSEITSLEKFYTALEKSVDDVLNTPAVVPGGNKGNSGGGGSKGSGSGGGGGYTDKVSIPSVKPSEDNKNDENQDVKKTEFPDIAGFEWAKEAIESLAASGAINGDPSGRFLPENNITRAEFVKILTAAFNIERTGESRRIFDDAKPTDWYYKPVMACVENGISNGISDTEFGAEANITREETAALLSRALNLSAAEKDRTFADEENISDYAKEHIYALCGCGIMNGYEDNTIRPQNALTRAEAAKLIYEAAEYKQRGGK